MVSKIRGQFTDFSAVVTIGRPFEQSTVEATVQMASVDTHGTDRDTHLRSVDFFDDENHPTMTFKSTKVTDNFLEGDLTIRGITRPVGFALDFVGISTDALGDTRAGFEATTVINSKDFDLTWSVGLEHADVLVGEKVKLAPLATCCAQTTECGSRRAGLGGFRARRLTESSCPHGARTSSHRPQALTDRFRA